MKRILSIVCLIIPFICYSQTTTDFVEAFREECNKCDYLRPVDSLVYIYTIMNLIDADSDLWENTSIEYKRDYFFAFFKKPILACDEAVDIKNEQFFRDPVGKIQFGQSSIYGHRQKSFYPVNVDYLCDCALARVKALTNYVSNNSFDFIFTIANLDDVYWIIKDDTLSVIQYDESNQSFSYYEADSFLHNVAEDAFFYSFSEFLSSFMADKAE